MNSAASEDWELTHAELEGAVAGRREGIHAWDFKKPCSLSLGQSERGPCLLSLGQSERGLYAGP